MRDQMYTIKYQSAEEYLRAHISGDLSDPETRIAAWREVIDRCRREEFELLLVIQESTGTKTEVEAFTSAKGIVELGLDAIKIAFVDFDPENHDINKFCELVAVNRGADAKAFSDETEALKWLRSTETILPTIPEAYRNILKT